MIGVISRHIICAKAAEDTGTDQSLQKAISTLSTHTSPNTHQRKNITSKKRGQAERLFKVLRLAEFSATNKRIVKKIVHLVQDLLTVIVDIHTVKMGFQVKVIDIIIKLDIINLVSTIKRGLPLKKMKD